MHCSALSDSCLNEYPVGLDVWFLVRPFVYFHTSCAKGKALASLRGSLVAYVISTIISWAGSFRNQSFFQLYINWSTKWVLVCLIYQYLLVWRAHLKSWDWRPAIPGITKGRMSMLILIYVSIPLATGHFVPKSFRTILVISYPLLFSIWSFRTQFGHFVPISYPVWSFRTYFYYF